MTKLIINADDFGYSKGVNYGIIESHLDGVVSSTTMMANMNGLDHALKMMPSVPELGIGVHLSLTMGKPVTDHTDGLVDDQGIFKSRNYYKTHTADLDQLYTEWKAQIEKLLKLGVELTHIDSHHYVHTFGDHLKVTEQLSEEFDLPVRVYNDVLERTASKKCYVTEAFWNLFNYPEFKDMSVPLKDKEKEIFSVIEKDAVQFSRYQTVEASCHPGFLDTDVYFNSSFNLPRMREVDVLSSRMFAELLNKNGYSICHYGQV